VTAYLFWFSLTSLQVRESGTGAAADEGAEEVGLFDLVGVYFVEGPAGAEAHKWYIRRVQKMYKALPGGRKVDYVLPVSLPSRVFVCRLISSYWRCGDCGHDDKKVARGTYCKSSM
jgi:hypothetical protein